MARAELVYMALFNKGEQVVKPAARLTPTVSPIGIALPIGSPTAGREVAVLVMMGE